MNDVITSAKSLLNVISDDVNDYPDASAYRQVQDRVGELNYAITEWEAEEELKEKRLG